MVFGDRRPILLDLFCGAGGCSVGYHRAGFDVIGVDNREQRHYPYGFRKGDALEALHVLLAGDDFQDVDAIHTSPPCQAYSQAALSQRGAGKAYPDLVAEVRSLLEDTGLPWVIENVPGAPVRPDFRICGCQVGLELRRVRLFETSWRALHMAPSCHHPHPVVSVVGHGTPAWQRAQLGYNPTIVDYRAAMGIDWMNRDELSQAIPPAYCELVGRALLEHMGQEAQAA